MLLDYISFLSSSEKQTLKMSNKITNKIKYKIICKICKIIKMYKFISSNNFQRSRHRGPR